MQISQGRQVNQERSQQEAGDKQSQRRKGGNERSGASKWQCEKIKTERQQKGGRCCAGVAMKAEI
jgi:hypothetical protein